MSPRLKIRVALASLALIAIALYDLWLWQPERQVLKHHEHLLRAAESKRWSRFAEFIDPQYADRWGHDKAFVVRESSEWLRHFFSLTIRDEMLGLDMSENRGVITAGIKLEGTGTAMADMAKNEVNANSEPFVFEWTRKSWKAWDWQFTRADNASAQFRALSE